MTIMNKEYILKFLKEKGSEGYKNILLRHGATEPCLGVKISDLKVISKKVKKDYELSLELFETGIYDAQYLAGLIADDARMSKADLQRWVDSASSPIAGSTVAWVTTGSPFGFYMAEKWIRSKKPIQKIAGWATLTCLVSIIPDADLDLQRIEELMLQVKKDIPKSEDRVKYQMLFFIISVGVYVQSLNSKAKQLAEEMGQVEVDMGETACQVPDPVAYIEKVEARGTIGKKRKKVKC